MILAKTGGWRVSRPDVYNGNHVAIWRKYADELEAERDKLREALRWTIEAIDITDWSRDGIEMLDSARQLYLDTREGGE